MAFRSKPVTVCTVEQKSFTIEGILDALRQRGMRVTRGRRSILAVLMDASEPLNLNEIRERAGTHGEMPDYATVFRMIALLEELRIVEKVNLQRSCSYYELRHPSGHYDHLICTACGKVEVLDLPCPLEAFEKKLQASYGFHTEAHSLEFFGRCQVCAA